MSECWVISGGRGFGVVLKEWDKDDIRRAHEERVLFMASMNLLLRERGAPSSVVTGGAPGADTLGEAWRVAQQLPGGVLKADWGKEPRRAGILRNTTMLRVARAVKTRRAVVFHTPGGDGTFHMVQIASMAGVECVPICGAISVFDMRLI